MEQRKLTGPRVGVHKYDLLTALSLVGLNGSKTVRTSMLRLIALVTARYNWRTDELTVGQRDMARMWAINERSVKREMKRLTDAEILICKRAGVRGRVGAYRLNQPRIADLSEPCWSTVGPDFEQRMRENYRKTEVKVVPLQNYRGADKPAPVTDGPWGRAMARLATEEPALFEAWFARLEFIDCENATLRLRTPGAFIQRYIETHLMRNLIEVAEQELGVVDRVIFDG